jgi:alpha-glucosidase (family GH31 glycosyl hydrolase)
MTTTVTTLVTHRPRGIEHPYATSLDQRVPVQPLAGQQVMVGVQAAAEVIAVDCDWEALPDPDVPATAVVLPMRRREADPAEASALAGGDGHLAEAQAAGLGGDGGWVVQSPPVEDGARYRYRFRARTGTGEGAPTGWFELLPARWTRHVPTPLAAYLTMREGRLVADSAEWLVTEDAVLRGRFALTLSEGDHVVGFGERFDHLDQRGKSLDAVVFEQYKAQGAHGRTYLPMPFGHVVNPDGRSWGFHVRTSRRTWYDVGTTDSSLLVVEADLGTSADATLDVEIYEGDPTSVLSQFLDEVGRAEELPDWVFRLWASGNEWNSQDLVMSRMDTHRDLGIPVGVVVIEAWSDEEGITIWRDAQYTVAEDGSALSGDAFTYPAHGAWPDPRAMVDELHHRGIKVILWQIPLLKTEQSEDGLHAQVLRDGAAMVRDGHAVREADGTAYLNRGWWFPKSLMPDLSVQRSRDWWTAKRDYLVTDLDVDGFKTDGGEHAWGHDLQYADGRLGDEGNNLYPVHYARTFGDLLRRHGKAPITFSRSGFTGSQAHGIFWAGDEDSTWEAFRNSITAGLTASSCGIVYWGWDMAGFSGPPPDAELYLRTAAAATFMPIMQYHSEFNHHRPPLRDRTPWHVAETSGDQSVVQVFRRYAQLRERLVPYLSRQSGHSVRTGRPLMRALFFDYPQDPRVWDHPQEFLLGDELLVNPVTQPGATTWTTYLPDGGWVDVWTGENVSGREETEATTPVDRVPVYCRAGSWPELRMVFDLGSSPG